MGNHQPSTGPLTPATTVYPLQHVSTHRGVSFGRGATIRIQRLVVGTQAAGQLSASQHWGIKMELPLNLSIRVTSSKVEECCILNCVVMIMVVMIIAILIKVFAMKNC
jgi:hypothetical protein